MSDAGDFIIEAYESARMIFDNVNALGMIMITPGQFELEKEVREDLAKLKIAASQLDELKVSREAIEVITEIFDKYPAQFDLTTIHQDELQARGNGPRIDAREAKLVQEFAPMAARTVLYASQLLEFVLANG